LVFCSVPRIYVNGGAFVFVAVIFACLKSILACRAWQVRSGHTYKQAGPGQTVRTADRQTVGNGRRWETDPPADRQTAGRKLQIEMLQLSTYLAMKPGAPLASASVCVCSDKSMRCMGFSGNLSGAKAESIPHKR